MAATHYRIAWRERLLEGTLLVCLSPIILLVWIWDGVSLRWRLWRHLRGSASEAWGRCAPLWSEAHCVLGGMIGPNLITPFVHALAENFAHAHPDSKAFLTRQLWAPDPYLAAYAFRCLIRFRSFSQEDIPDEVLRRTEEIEAMRFGCCLERLALGQYMQEYFGLPGFRPLSLAD